MSKATLVVMAAGIGSRFGGGVKQLSPVGPNGEIIIDYSIYDAIQAGFDKVVFVIRKDLEADFKAVIGDRISKVIDVAYAFQEVNDLPGDYVKKFPDRTKPWGTGQAILCAKDVVDSPFLVINADDYYGKQAYQEGFRYLTSETPDDQIAMVGFILKNTLSENGAVTRGLCATENGMLTKIVETKNIYKTEDGACVRTEEEERTVDPDGPVSMNMWALKQNFFNILDSGFTQFLEATSPEEPKAEYLLPTIIGGLLEEGKIGVRVLESHDKWFGVTYKEDRQSVVDAIGKLVEDGVYPSKLYE